MADGGRLRRLRFGVAECPLHKPYELSFVSIAEFQSVWVMAEDEDGRVGLGEAVPLPGYNWETLETIHATVAMLSAGADGQPCSAIAERCRLVRAEHPFAASAVMTALDMTAYLDRADPAVRFAPSAPVASERPPPPPPRAGR